MRSLDSFFCGEAETRFAGLCHVLPGPPAWLRGICAASVSLAWLEEQTSVHKFGAAGGSGC
jgi:hypothetical protein